MNFFCLYAVGLDDSDEKKAIFLEKSEQKTCKKYSRNLPLQSLSKRAGT